MVKGVSRQLLREHTLVSLSAPSMHLRQQHVLMQPGRLSRAAGKLCRKHAWNAGSKQRHVPDTKQVLLWKGWVLKPRLYMMFNHASGQLLPGHTWNPRCSQNCSWTHVQQDIRATAARAHAHSPPLDLHPHTRRREMFMRQHCCARTPPAHLDLPPYANRHVPAKRLLRSHAASTLVSLSVRKQTTLLHSHAVRQHCCVRTL